MVSLAQLPVNDLASASFSTLAVVRPIIEPSFYDICTVRCSELPHITVLLVAICRPRHRRFDPRCTMRKPEDANNRRHNRDCRDKSADGAAHRCAPARSPCANNTACRHSCGKHYCVHPPTNKQQRETGDAGQRSQRKHAAFFVVPCLLRRGARRNDGLIRFRQCVHLRKAARPNEQF